MQDVGGADDSQLDDRALALASLDAHDRALIEQDDRYTAERTHADRQHQAQLAARNPNRLPVSGVLMCRQPGQRRRWRPGEPSRLTREERVVVEHYGKLYAQARVGVVARVRRAACSPRARRRREGTRASARSGDSGSSGDPDGEGELGPPPFARHAERALLLKVSRLLVSLETPRRDPWAVRELPLGLWRLNAIVCRRLASIEGEAPA